MNRNVILLTQFSRVYLLTKSYIVYMEIYVVPIGHGFSFFGHVKVMENQC